MQKRQLGRGGPMVGAVALGTMNFCGTYGPADPGESLRCMEACLDMGIDHLDTSDVYGAGRAEELLAPFLKRHRGRIALASKFGITRDPDHPYDNSPGHMRQSLEGSLRRMGVDHIDLYYVHRREAARPIEEVMEALLRLRDQGKIGAIGLSEVAPATLERALAVGPVAAVQSEYSLWTRLPELGLLQACAGGGAALVGFSPVGRGAFGDPPPDPVRFGRGDIRHDIPRFEGGNWTRNLTRLRRFAGYARDHGESPAAMAIAWVLARGPHVIALPGSRSIAHMRENARGAAITVAADRMAEIEAILPPGWAHGARYNEVLSRGPENYC